MDYKDKVAVITGGCSGLGIAFSEALAEAGADIVLGDIMVGTPSADEACATVQKYGTKVMPVKCDVTSPESADNLIATTVKEFGKLDILINSAGLFGENQKVADMDPSNWDKVLAVDLKGTFLCTQRAAHWMKDTGGGAIVNIGSGANKLPFPNLVDYVASKGGIDQFTRVSAVELGPHGIRVNCVAPGAIEIERTKLELPDYAGMWGSITPLRRIGAPADVAKAVVYLASDDADFVTGQTLYVDGGLFTQAPWPNSPAD